MYWIHSIRSKHQACGLQLEKWCYIVINARYVGCDCGQAHLVCIFMHGQVPGLGGERCVEVGLCVRVDG